MLGELHSTKPDTPAPKCAYGARVHDHHGGKIVVPCSTAHCCSRPCCQDSPSPAACTVHLAKCERPAAVRRRSLEPKSRTATVIPYAVRESELYDVRGGYTRVVDSSAPALQRTEHHGNGTTFGRGVGERVRLQYRKPPDTPPPFPQSSQRIRHSL
ncbi:hypothetical protein QTP88_017676 [Uroleucon formosanum]